MPIATVLYEDKMQPGSGHPFPPHDFVLAMVSDLTRHTIWDLRKRVCANPRNGVDKLIADLKRTRFLAESGMLCILVDRDRIAAHLKLPKSASEDEIIAALRDRSDAPDKLSVHFLDLNIEGLMRSIEACAPDERAPSTKGHNARDIYLNRAAFALSPAVRNCVKGKQPSLGKLVELLADLCRSASA